MPILNKHYVNNSAHKRSLNGGAVGNGSAVSTAIDARLAIVPFEL